MFQPASIGAEICRYHPSDCLRIAFGLRDPIERRQKEEARQVRGFLSGGAPLGCQIPLCLTKQCQSVSFSPVCLTSVDTSSIEPGNELEKAEWNLGREGSRVAGGNRPSRNPKLAIWHKIVVAS
jgi:hypothetical protein